MFGNASIRASTSPAAMDRSAPRRSTTRGFPRGASPARRAAPAHLWAGREGRREACGSGADDQDFRKCMACLVAVGIR